MFVPRLIQILVLIALATAVASATPITFIGPVFPKDNGPGKGEGTPCATTTPGCIIGDPTYFEVFQATLTSPMAGSTQWTLQIETNYGPPAIQGGHLIPGSPDIVPAYVFSPGFPALFMGDFNIQWNGGNYALVMHPHDGYAAGDLYQSSGYQLQSSLTLGFFPENPNHTVLLNGGGSLQGAGTLTGAETGDSVTSAHYTLTDTFNAPANFLSTGTFTIDFASYECANGVLEGSGGFVSNGGGAAGGGVPEPGTLLLVAPALALVVRRAFRRAA